VGGGDAMWQRCMMNAIYVSKSDKSYCLSRGQRRQQHWQLDAWREQSTANTVSVALQQHYFRVATTCLLNVEDRWDKFKIMDERNIFTTFCKLLPPSL
jgi:hypothetical protein